MSEENNFNSFWEPSTPQGDTEDISNTNTNDTEETMVSETTIVSENDMRDTDNTNDLDINSVNTSNVNTNSPDTNSANNETKINDVSPLISLQSSEVNGKPVIENNTELNNGYYNRFYNGNNGGNYNGNYNGSNGGANNGYYNGYTGGNYNGNYNGSNGGANNGYYNGYNGSNYNGNYNGYNGSNYNGNYNWKPNNDKAEKTNKRIWMAIVVAIVLLLIVCAGIWIDVFVRAYKMEEENPGSFNESMDDFLGEDSGYDYDGSESDYDEEYDDESEYDGSESEETEIDWDDQTWKEPHINYAKEDVGDEYYTSIVDCKDETVSYKIKDEYYEYYEEENNVCMRVHYIQLEGDLPNLEQINEHIEAEALYYVDQYEYDLEEYAEELEESNEPYIINVDSYVTYNDNELISIVLEEDCNTAIGNILGLYGISINLATGTVLENTGSLSATDEFLEDFRAKNEYQNGENAGNADDFTNDEIKNYMENEGTLIIFYTPLGMEIGYNYIYDEQIGWVSVTFTDYQKYLKSL